MGRHRRAHAAPAAHDPALSPTAERARVSHRKRRRTPVKTGLLGISAAAAVGTVAVGSGFVPGAGDGFGLIGGDDDPATSVRAGDGTATPFQGAGTGADDRDEAAASRDEQRTTPSAKPSPSPSDEPGAKKSPEASKTPDGQETERGGDADAESGGKNGETAPKTSAPPTRTTEPTRPAPKPTTPAPPTSKAPGTPGDSGAHSQVEAQVLALVNQERAKAGCQAVRADADLARLAGSHSRDMAARGYFSHTDPEGRSPFDRAREAGVDHMGGENIARGQASAEAVMESWMNSPGHRANILNCDFTTLGVGAHVASGGPWWTQAFGY
ncbi:CAP domain-containing protein [Streptomyces sp. JJ66]|uniref:CAP domain-containing protein n=1 Tax=Streptomyces sp. JJ66 TaxID=2803843 RepID=UPI001C58AB4A|nr:CAP domain-containing protein [Streptomyces sp. JJ66]MBW1601285.1 CAP domain-containing protein [Streptomyces sp. JJ66]